MLSSFIIHDAAVDCAVFVVKFVE